MKAWSNKKKRIVIGILMMYGFVDLAFTINFFAQLGHPLASLVAMGVFNYFWVPNIMLIILSYHVLTKVYKYEDKTTEKRKERLLTK